MCTPVSYERGRAVAYIVFFLLAVTAALTQTKSAKKAVEDKPLLQYAKLPVYFEQNVDKRTPKYGFCLVEEDTVYF
jgi:hypothetical protein